MRAHWVCLQALVFTMSFGFYSSKPFWTSELIVSSSSIFKFLLQNYMPASGMFLGIYWHFFSYKLQISFILFLLLFYVFIHVSCSPSWVIWLLRSLVCLHMLLSVLDCTTIICLIWLLKNFLLWGR